MKRILITVGFLTLTILTVSCVELKEIREFSELAGSVGERFPVLATDLYDSCANQQRYIVLQKHDFRFDKLGDLNDESNAEMVEALKQCELYNSERERLIKANGILVAYMKTMGDLAADDLTNFDKNIDGFGKAVTSAKLLNDAQSTALMNLGKFLSHIATEGYRRKKLKEVIKTTNGDVQVATSALSDIVQKNYILQLQNEQLAMETYYRRLAAEESAFTQFQVSNARTALLAAKNRGETISDPSVLNILNKNTKVSSPAVLDDLKTKFEAKNAAINLRIKGAGAYVKILKQVGEAHQKLYDNADRLSSRELLSSMLSYAKTIKSLAGDFQKAF